ncbi:amidohydrolase [Caballeronia arvi]|uniref:Amidohydrolase n=1 Tax=Caballeronia arvi TaxID=1777135 RepID=A0A158K9R0_9BURK|nr:amidohydrolase family protein [Caballeronia arvi]SAL77847.1 amidohydrolase [Caballeronia arvi]
MNSTDIETARERFLDSGDDRDLPIVDAHHHFWDLTGNYHPWLCDLPRIPFRYGDYEAICRDFLPQDYFDQARGHLVVKTVMMEGEWNPLDPVGEARWATDLNERTGSPNAMAGQIWLDRDDVGEVLSAYHDLPIVRSVRHKPKTVPRDQHRNDFAPPGSMRCSRWRRGFEMLARTRLSFELQAPWWHFGEAAELARDFPGTKIIVNHAGLPADRSAAAIAAWGDALELLAAFPNVWLKISGIGEPDVRWSVERNGRIVRDAIERFGVERCVFASNFPVDSLVVTLDELFTGFKEMVAHLPREQRLALFHDNASRLYGL